MREVKTFEELEKPINLTVKTRCPEKYLLIDRENGDVFLSMIGPEEWDQVHVGTFILDSDNKWKKLQNFR